MWLLLLKFLLAHFLGDFVFQTRKMVQHKTEPKYFALHIAVHAVLLCLFLWNDAVWWAVLIVILSHTLIDIFKLKLTEKVNGLVLFLSDQLVHLSVIVLVLCAFSDLKISLTFFSEPVFWLAVCAFVLVTQVTAVFIRIVLEPYQHQKNSETVDSYKTKSNTIKFRAGKYIGVLERLFILGFVIGNFWEGIGFLLAAKSIFRFGDLNNAKERHLTEYVLIGTLLSFGAAILVGLLFNLGLKWIQ